MSDQVKATPTEVAKIRFNPEAAIFKPAGAAPPTPQLTPTADVPWLSPVNYRAQRSARDHLKLPTTYDEAQAFFLTNAGCVVGYSVTLADRFCLPVIFTYAELIGKLERQL